MKPYAIVSDLHCHAWSAFASVDPTGVNTRLGLILTELRRAAAELWSAGGDTIVIAGDLFHVRGSIDPEVYNAVHDTIRDLVTAGFRFYAIPGNHDLKGRETTQLGNAMHAIMPGAYYCATKPMCIGIGDHVLALVPWISKTSELLKVLEELARDLGDDIKPIDLIIHAGIDGVLPNMPDHGLSAKKLASFGFRRVFAGHYHNHKDMGDGVYSIGATTHQTWSDIGTKAGYLIVDDKTVRHRASNAPSFIEITDKTDTEEIPLLVDGNYVRIRGMKLTDAEVTTMRDELEAMGAWGVTFQVAREVVAARSGAVATKTVTLEESIASFIDTLDGIDAASVKAGALDVMTKVRSITV